MWAVGSWPEGLEPGASETSKEAMIMVQATGGAKRSVGARDVGRADPCGSQSLGLRVGRGRHQREGVGRGGPLERAHSTPGTALAPTPPAPHTAGSAGSSPHFPGWEQPGLGSLSAPRPVWAGSAPHCTSGSYTYLFLQAASPCQIDEQRNKGGNHIIPECILIKIK